MRDTNCKVPNRRLKALANIFFININSKKSKVTNINRKMRPETCSLFEETEWILEVCT
jgi:hypothetical protein